MNKFLKSINLYNAIVLMGIFARFLYKKRNEVVIVIIFSLASYQVGVYNGETQSPSYTPKLSKKEQAEFDKEKAEFDKEKALLIADLEKVAGKF